MAAYLFQFGYQSSSISGSDDEDSSCIWIEAESKEKAIEWGIQVATAFVASRWPELPPWKECGFAHWLEEDAAVLKWAADNAIPKVKYGDLPKKWNALDPKPPKSA